MQWTADQVECMVLEEEVAAHGVLLPSLEHACQTMEVEMDDDSEVMRKNLLDKVRQEQPSRPFLYECPKLREMRVLLQCPICHTIAPQDEIVSVCPHHHHLCFRCLVAVAGSSNPTCPMRCGPLEPGPPPSPLLRSLLEILDVGTAKPSEEWQLYQQLVHCGYYAQPWCLAQLRQFSGMMKDKTTLARMRGCSDMYRNFRAFLNALPPPDTAPQI